jgi:hypothetical protein
MINSRSIASLVAGEASAARLEALELSSCDNLRKSLLTGDAVQLSGVRYPIPSLLKSKNMKGAPRSHEPLRSAQGRTEHRSRPGGAPWTAELRPAHHDRAAVRFRKMAVTARNSRQERSGQQESRNGRC